MSRKLSISNLAWPADAEIQILQMAAKRGVTGVEVAPTRLAPWKDLTPQRLQQFRGLCAGLNLTVSSLQAIFYLKPEAALLGDEAAFTALCEHLRRVTDIAAELGAGVAVFGAPKNRLRGELAWDQAMRRGEDRLRTLGMIAAEGPLVLGIEPVPVVYGADFLNNARDVLDIVRRVNHPCIRPHLDTACVALAGDDIGEAVQQAGSLLAHFHAAEPDLGDFAASAAPHARAAEALDTIGYAGWVAIEMREPRDPATTIADAIDYVKAQYLR